MSRRESRVSMNVRQNDALLEFESFKKKFLLANKHITKLNSTLSMKIEELNTEISTLYTENLRLRASEIALAAQLKREREKSRKILSDAEAATQTLSAHFGFLRQTFNIPVHAPPSPTATPPHRPTISPRNSNCANNVNRLAREPQVSNIHEDEEEPEDLPAPPSPPRKAKKKTRLSASKLPLPARSSTPPDGLVPPKKRRQSGLIVDLGVVDIDALDFDDRVNEACENERQKEKEREKEKERKRRARDDGTLGGVATKPKPRLKDVTNSNSPRPRSKADPALDAALTIETQIQARSFLVAAPPSPPPPEPKALPVPPQLVVVPQPPAQPQPRSQPVSSGSSSSVDSASDRDREQRLYSAEPVAAATGTETGGRERRNRKSVNYAEPKLNTKMRKPEPPAGAAPTPAPVKRARSSAAAAIPVHAGASASKTAPRRPSPPLRTSARPLADEVDEDEDEEEKDDDDEEDDDDSDGWADGEFLPQWASGHVNVDQRRRALHGHGERQKGEVSSVVADWTTREREREARRHSAVV
ncbi:hypothetical protein MSAN_01245700 [Mycena sanguinolenta]|uniref:Shugoshin C-terminal domain-containing protein n=1 Tax=Mycena sanguinolenta TaxID=230812 RepID=A0A8H6YG27_9AGAR|nr:hypothetical protein MSAN_01245700 [Mycena sanguinolenta]